MPDCMKCGKKLDKDDIGAYKRLVNRGASEFLCVRCLAAYFNVDEKLIREKIEHFRKMGCALFN